MVGCWGLVLGTSLTWWAVRMGPGAPPAPALLTQVISRSQTAEAPTEAPLHGGDHGGFGSAEPPEGAGQAAAPPPSSTRAPQRPIASSVQKRTAFQAGDDPVRALRVPVLGSLLTVQKARQRPAHRDTQRAGRPRGAPGKSARSHTRAGPSQQARG